MPKGSAVQQLLTKVKSAGIGTIPDTPQLRSDLVPSWDAFVRCHKRRDPGKPLPLTEIEKACDDEAVDLEDSRRMQRRVEALDDYWVAEMREKSKRPRATGSTSKPSGRRLSGISPRVAPRMRPPSGR